MSPFIKSFWGPQNGTFLVFFLKKSALYGNLQRLQKCQYYSILEEVSLMPLKIYLDKRKNKHGEAPVVIYKRLKGLSS